MAGNTQRRLAAIVSADVVGYSRLMGVDEAGTLAALRNHRAELIDGKIAEHGGRIVKTMGDGLLLEFPSVVDATQCVIDVQQAMTKRNDAIDEDKRIVFRIGVHLGDLIVEGDDIFGDGINVAARLEAFCEAGGIAISGTVHENISGRIEAGFVDAGDQQLKNISRPVRVWQWTPTASSIAVPSEALALPDKPSIAVLPFDNMSGDPEQEFFADGITEDIITGLSRIRQFFVIARNSTFNFKDRTSDIQSVAKALGVRYVLEGSVRKAGQRVRVTAQLVDAISGNHVWAERYDRNLEDIFQVQDEITQEIMAAVAPELATAEMQRARRKDVTSLDAWESTMRAYWHTARPTIEDNTEAKRLAEEAIRLAPAAAAGFSVLSFANVLDVIYGWTKSREQSLTIASKLAQKAVALDDRDAQAHMALGMVTMSQRRHDDAIRQFQRAIDLDPNYAIAHGFLGLVFAMCAQSEEAVASIETAIRLSPRDTYLPRWFVYLGAANFVAERYEEAAKWARTAIQENPNFLLAHRLLAGCCGLLGEIDEARAAVAEVLRLVPGHSISAFRDQIPYKYPADQERYADGLRLAGLPEE